MQTRAALEGLSGLKVTCCMPIQRGPQGGENSSSPGPREPGGGPATAAEGSEQPCPKVTETMGPNRGKVWLWECQYASAGQACGGRGKILESHQGALHPQDTLGRHPRTQVYCKPGADATAAQTPALSTHPRTWCAPPRPPAGSSLRTAHPWDLLADPECLPVLCFCSIPLLPCGPEPGVSVWLYLSSASSSFSLLVPLSISPSLFSASFSPSRGGSLPPPPVFLSLLALLRVRLVSPL